MNQSKSLWCWRGWLSAAALCLIAGFAPALAAQSEYAHPWNNPHQPIQKRVQELVSQMTLKEEIAQMMNDAPAIPRLGVPAYNWWSEGLHGVARSGYATVFPQAIGMAATFDPNAVATMADTISTEARAKYNWAIRHNLHSIYYGLTLWAPNINIVRDPRWGRGQETYGESPFLTGTMAVQFVRGLQGDNPTYLKTIATPKHFAVYNGPESMRHQINAEPSAHDFEGTYLPAFRMAVTEGHADSIMCSYNEVYGEPSCANPRLLTDILRERWGFGGFVTSDCGAIWDFYRPGAHGFSPDAAHASASAVLAGTDTDCGSAYMALDKAVAEGLISKAAIDRAVERLFTARFRLGMFDPTADVPYNRIPMSEVDSPAHRALALAAANESMVLLKNAGDLLPLKDEGVIAVIGPNAADLNSIEGNYHAIPSHPVLPVDGIAAAFPKAKVIYAQGSSFAVELPVPTPRTQFRIAPGSSVEGLTGQYYANTSFTGKPVVTRIDKQIDFDWSAAKPVPGVPMKAFGVRWTGTIQVPVPGAYKMQVDMPECDPCSDRTSYRVWLNGKLVANPIISSEEYRSSKPNTFVLDFKDTQPHAFTLEYTHHTRLFGAGVTLNWYPPEQALREQAVEAARKANVVVAVLGLSPTFVGEEMSIQVPGFDKGDRTRLTLPATQESLLRALAATGKPVVLVLVNGSALAVDWAKQHVPAILEAWYPGEAGGEAIGQTLSGQNDPGGKLPLTFYASVKDLPPFTDFSMKDRTYRYYTGQPLFAFGYGLSYTTFDYSGVHLSTKTLRAGEPLVVTAEVRNAGKVAGDAVTEVYVTPPQNGVNPLRELRGFNRVHLAPGESREVRFTLTPRDLSLVNAQGARSVAPGDYSIFVGGSQPTGAAAQTVAFHVDGSKALPE